MSERPTKSQREKSVYIKYIQHVVGKYEKQSVLSQ